MMQKDQDMLDEFKKLYILKKATEMAQDYEFIKGFTLKKISEYTQLLLEFLQENEKKINALVADIKINKNNLFLKELNFINEIPKLIRFSDNEFEIDYVLLTTAFKKIEDEDKRIELNNSLKELEEEFSSINSKLIKFKGNTEFNISDLYNFGEFILSFLNNFELRKKISINLLNLELEANSNKFEKMFNKEYIKTSKNINTWSSINNARI